jgi:hypothetical protein
MLGQRRRRVDFAGLHFQHILELILDDDRLNVHAVEGEVRPPGAPTA